MSKKWSQTKWYSKAPKLFVHGVKRSLKNEGFYNYMFIIFAIHNHSNHSDINLYQTQNHKISLHLNQKFQRKNSKTDF